MPRPRRANTQYYDWENLREGNIDYVAAMTGHSKKKLRKILRHNKDKGIHEVQIPYNTPIFTREES